jgi:chitinase
VESTGDGNEADETEKCLEFDYCDLPRPGTKEQYDQSAGAAFCVDDDGGAGFITYDSTQTVRQKARFASEMNLGGLFYWHIAADARGDRSLIATGYNALHGF